MHPLADLRYALRKLLREKCKKFRRSFASMVSCDLREADFKYRFFSWSRYFYKANLPPIDTKDASIKNAKPDDVKRYKA
jgi:uncharacterized protein YjbI with pentapeptide repeats